VLGLKIVEKVSLTYKQQAQLRILIEKNRQDIKCYFFLVKDNANEKRTEIKYFFKQNKSFKPRYKSSFKPRRQKTNMGGVDNPHFSSRPEPNLHFTEKN